MLRTGSIVDGGLNFIPYGKRPRNIRKVPLLRGLSADAQNGNQGERQGANKKPGESPRKFSRDARSQPGELTLRSLFRVSHVLGKMYCAKTIFPAWSLHFFDHSPG
jgi:hypothetical protein